MTDDLIPPAPAPKRKRFSLDDLLGDTRPQAVGVSDLPTAKEIRLDRITGDPNQPRRTFDEERLGELADSIRIEGVLQPVVVRYDKERATSTSSSTASAGGGPRGCRGSVRSRQSSGMCLKSDAWSSS